MYPKVQNELHGHEASVNIAMEIVDEEIFITGSNDLSLRCWVKRENGTIWPCVWESVDSPIRELAFDRSADMLIVGLESGNFLVYDISHDFNTVKLSSNVKAHNSAVSYVGYDPDQKIIISAGTDGFVRVFNGESHQQICHYTCSSGVCAAYYNNKEKVLYCGLNNGNLVGVSIDDSRATLAHAFSSIHTDSINDVCVDEATNTVFTAGDDKLIGIWDPKTLDGIALHKHSGSVKSISFIPEKKTLLSLDSTGKLVSWNMTAKREKAAVWTEADSCELCAKPFFWNVQKKSLDFSNFSIPLPKFNTNRQHHCRKCGKAVCNQCAPTKRAIPYHGFEEQVFICKECVPELKDHEIKTTITETHTLAGMETIRVTPKSDTFIATFSNFCAKTLSLP